MLIKLPMFWIVTLNLTGWLVIQLGAAWFFLRLPTSWFDFARPQKNSRGKFFYERILRVKSWKDQLPDAGGWFNGGFAKKALAEKNADYWRRFVAETRRGESCHWVAIAFVPIFWLWNPWWGVWVNAAYALAANLPCIVAQRYNRARLLALLARC